MKVYAFPDVGRAGLGNMLFPWARAEVFRKRYGVPMLAPQWTQPKIGPLLRGEKDKRYYVGLFDNAHSRYVRGLAKYIILARTPKVPQADADRLMADRHTLRGARVVVFSGWTGWFDGVVADRDFVVSRLHEILKPALKQRLAATTSDFVIAAHVRRGDKPLASFGDPWGPREKDSRGMPDQWFINCIRSVRAALGSEAPVQIFSDAPKEQIPGILGLPGVTLAGPNPSIVDIFLLSRARVLITTATSSFSAWASYIGGMPTIWYPGLKLDLNPHRPGLGVETDLQGRLGAEAARVIASAAQAGGA